MNSKDITLIRDKVTNLTGAKGFTIGRAASMAWIGFYVGHSEYALHLQTAFRIRTNETILIANSDMFEPTETLENSPSFDWDTYHWDVQGFNKYDEWAKKFKQEYGDTLTVQKVTITTFGDLTIELDQNIIIETFINSATEECWRLFERNSKEHLVITGQGVEDSF